MSLVTASFQHYSNMYMPSDKGAIQVRLSVNFQPFLPLLISFFFMALVCPPLKSHATTCDVQGGTNIIGYEYVATSCVPDGMNDGTAIGYARGYIICSGGVVSNDPNDYYGIIYGSAMPKDIVDGKTSAGFKVLRNKEGSHIVGVHRYYTGLIDGKSMAGYGFGAVYDDPFTSPIYVFPSTPDCQGGDYNGGCNEQPSGSTVNLGTGRLSHDQKIFSVNSGLSLALDISLYYRSIPFAPSDIGDGWSHTYEMTLQNGVANSKVFWYQGARRIYNIYGVDTNGLPVGSYTSPKGDYSTLVKNGDSTWTITEPDGLRRNFDSSGNVTTLMDKYGNTLTFGYTNGKLTSVTDPSSRTVSIGYDPTSGKLTTITDPNNKAYSLAYPSGKLDTVTLPGGDQWGYTYNASNGLLETKTDPALFMTTYYYTGQKVTSAKDPNQKTRGYGFAASAPVGKIPDIYQIATIPAKSFTFTDKDQNSWPITYDTLSENIRTKADPLTNTTSYTYYQNGLTKSVTKPPLSGISYTTFYTYDTMGNVSSETEPLNLVADFNNLDPNTVVDPATDSRIKDKLLLSYTYDLTNTNPAFRNLITRMDDKRGPNVITTTYAYSVDGSGYLVTTVTDPTMATTVTRYYSSGKIKDVTDANQKVTTYSYYDNTSGNQSGFLKTVVTPDGITTSYFDPTGSNVAYDANGNNVWYAVLDKDGVLRKTVISVYDDRNRLSTVTTRVTGQADIVTTYGYDGNDNVNSVKDAEQKETKYLFDFNRQTTKITDARSKDTNLIYGGTSCPSCGNGADKLTEVKDANQHSTTYSYDTAGRLEYESDPMGKKYHYTYHPNGKLDKKYNATSGSDVLQVTYSYNNRGQLTGKQYADNGTTPSASYDYDSNGRLQSAGNGNIGYTFSNYTGGSYKGRLKNVTDITHNRTVSYNQYDKLGQRQQVAYSGPTGSRTINYQYDDANRPWIISIASKAFTYLYDKLGRRDTISYPNGVTVKHGYDDLERLSKIKHSTSTATITFANYSGFDKTGSRKNKITPNGTETYHYDDIYRLTQTDTPKGSEKYTHDDVGNRTGGPGPKESLPIVTYVHDNANRMTHGKQLGYTYDDAGNQITRTIPNAPDKGWTLTWDLENRLTQVYIFRKVSNVVVESRTVEFKYDPFDRRIEKKVTTLLNGTTKVIGTWQYLYDGNNIAAEYYTDSGGTTTTYYIHGPGTDEHLAMERGGAYYYFHADGLGSITAITDSTATPVQTYSYDSFGVTKQTTIFRNNYMYVGKEYDSETGLTEMGARYYDPREGRFLSKDPIGFDGGDVNLYGYTSNNPINLVDPEGLCVEDACVGEGVAALIACLENPACAAALVAGATATANAIEKALICLKEHTKNPRPSNWDKHTKPRSGGPEKADNDRRPPRQKPPGHRGAWPKKPDPPKPSLK